MAGLSINCGLIELNSKTQLYNKTHVQSMAFALDKIGLGIIQTSGVVYDCHKNSTAMIMKDRVDLVDRYEIGMSRAILQSNYSITAWFSSGNDFHPKPVIYSSTMGDCHDIWNVRHLRIHSLGCPSKSPSCNLTFFKTSRLIPPDISKEVGFQMENAELEELMTTFDGRLNQ
eukprot:scaffold4502_cov121-Cylindrotheca_fusiformis.AAC.2